MTADTTMAPGATTIDIPTLIRGLLARSDNPPDIEVDVEQLAQMLTTDDGKNAVYRMMQAEYRDRQDAARALATLTEQAEFVSDVIKAICDHVGITPEPEGYTAADLDSLLEEHNAAISQDREAQSGQVVLAKEMAMEMVRAHEQLTDFVRESSDPGTDALCSVWCMAQLIHKARSAGLLPADNRATPTQAPAESRSVVFTAPVALHTNTVTLIADFASALATKLRASEIKYGWTADWMRKGWRDELASELLRHVHKGDPRDVAAYCAFAWFHGWSVAPSPQPQPAAALVEALKAYEAWEADVILNAGWTADLPRLTQAQWDRLVEIQGMRNAALRTAHQDGQTEGEGNGNG